MTHQQSIRLQVLADDLAAASVNLSLAEAKYKKASAVFVDYVESLEEKEEKPE